MKPRPIEYQKGKGKEKGYLYDFFQDSYYDYGPGNQSLNLEYSVIAIIEDNNGNILPADIKAISIRFLDRHPEKKEEIKK